MIARARAARAGARRSRSRGAGAGGRSSRDGGRRRARADARRGAGGAGRLLRLERHEQLLGSERRRLVDGRPRRRCSSSTPSSVLEGRGHPQRRHRLRVRQLRVGGQRVGLDRVRTSRNPPTVDDLEDLGLKAGDLTGDKDDTTLVNMVERAAAARRRPRQRAVRRVRADEGRPGRRPRDRTSPARTSCATAGCGSCCASAAHRSPAPAIVYLPYKRGQSQSPKRTAAPTARAAPARARRRDRPTSLRTSPSPAT